MHHHTLHGHSPKKQKKPAAPQSHFHLPAPAFSFTLPSLHDDTVLDCRVHHPSCLSFDDDDDDANLHRVGAWKKRVAIVAHPYPPMGGCYDDPVVNIVGAALLRKGWIVGTFNFRGAGSSKGRTSWTAKPEQGDYASVVGFLAFYIHLLRLPSPLLHDADSDADDGGHRGHAWHDHRRAALHSGTVPASPTVAEEAVPPDRPGAADHDEHDHLPTFLLAGYSYGSMITMLVPDLPTILEPFQSPIPGSAASEVRLRAQSMAAQQSLILQSLCAAAQLHHHAPPTTLDTESLSPKRVRGRSPRPSHDDDGHPRPTSIRVGGEETEPALRKPAHAHAHADHHPKRSFSLDAPREAVRRSVDLVRGRSVKAHHREDSAATPPPRTPVQTTADRSGASASTPPDALPRFREAYLLISPLQGLVSHLATMSLVPRRAGLFPSPESALAFDGGLAAHEAKLARHPALAVYGDEDIFTSRRRLHAWAERLQAASAATTTTTATTATATTAPSFSFVEAEGVGHFWHDRGAATTLRGAVERFVETLVVTRVDTGMV